MQLDLPIEGLTCLDCARKVERALRALPGVRQASVNYPTGQATIAADDMADLAALRAAATAAVQNAGYKVSDTRDGVDNGRITAETISTSTAMPKPSRAAPEPPRDWGGAHYDLLAIGSGAAGMAAVIRAAELGARAAIVEAAEVVGGTCVNIGCIPSKHLIEAAHHYHSARSRYPAGISACTPELAWREVLREKQAVVDTLRKEKYLKVLEAYETITLLHGRAVLEPARGAATETVVRVRVGDRLVRARNVVIATGAAPATPPIPGLVDVGPLDSTSAMELGALPASLLVVGGGSIGLELGQAFARFGVRVTVLEMEDRILPTEDPDLSAALAAALQAEGMEIHTGVHITKASRSGGAVVLTIERGGVRGEVQAEQVLVATGRRANTQGLGLEGAGVHTDGLGFIPTDGFMRTSHPAIYAAGDVTGGPGFVYVAALQGGIAAQAALADQAGEKPIPIDLTATPRVTFTDPQVAAVGLTDSEARAARYDPKTTSLPAAALPRAAVSYRRQGLIKLVADAPSDRLLGVHIVAPNAGDIIAEAALAVKFALTAQNLVSTLHPYLTWAEGLKLAAQTFTKDVALLSCCA